MRRAATVVVAALLLCAPALAGCSVSTNEEPVAAGDVFQDFVEPTTTTTSVTTPAAPKGVPVYFLDQGTGGTTMLRVATRTFEVGAEVQEILDDLFTRPPDTEGTEREREEGLTTAIPEDAVLQSAEPASEGARELVVDVSGLFGSIDGSQLRNALAQIVWTATAFDGVDSVSFQTDGETRSPIVGNGETVERPVTRDDYDLPLG